MKPKVAEGGATDNLLEEDMTPKTRPRSKSDRFNRQRGKQVVEVYKQVGKQSQNIPLVGR